MGFQCFPHTNAKWLENVFKTNGSINICHSELKDVYTTAHSLTRSIVCDQSVDYFTRKFSIYIKNQGVESKTRPLSELLVLRTFDFSPEEYESWIMKKQRKMSHN